MLGGQVDFNVKILVAQLLIMFRGPFGGSDCQNQTARNEQRWPELGQVRTLVVAAYFKPHGALAALRIYGKVCPGKSLEEDSAGVRNRMGKSR